MSDPPRTLCERLRTLADACERFADALRTQRNDLASPPGPLDPNFKTGTLLLRIREKVTTVLRFASVDSPACPTLRERLRTIADALRTLCEHNATTSRRLLDPWTPTLKREPFCYAFGKNSERNPDNGNRGAELADIRLRSFCFRKDDDKTLTGQQILADYGQQRFKNGVAMKMTKVKSDGQLITQHACPAWSTAKISDENVG